MKRVTGLVLCLIGVVGIFALSIYSRLGNVDASETRLFVDYWPWWLGFLAALLGGFGLIAWDEEATT